jgi:hypothetical protein
MPRLNRLQIRLNCSAGETYSGEMRENNPAVAMRRHPMSASAARMWLLAALAIALVGCTFGDKEKEADPNIFPINYKREVLATLMKTLEDQTNLRDTYISDPVLMPVGNDRRYTICVRYNARDPNHHYMGSEDRIGYFYGGHLNQLIEASKEQCGNAAYKPFPELGKLCQVQTCP